MVDAMPAPDRAVVGVLCVEGADTGDGRKIDTNSLRWTLPQPLRWVKEDFGAHNGAVVVGAIEKIVRTDTGELAYSGTLFDTPAGTACYEEMYTRFAASGLKFGISVDLDDVVVEEDGDTMVVKEGRLRGATLCDIPAYNTAYTMLSGQIPMEALVAAAPRTGVPAAWFSDPGFSEPTPLTVTDDGRVFGHAALWGTCHLSFQDTCVMAPRSKTNYAYYRSGLVTALDGEKIPVGHITLGTGHANARLSAGPAADHYDNTGATVADVAAGEDRFGLWLSGSVREGVTDAQIRELQAHAVSGDWRSINGNLELVAMLSVNVPGFGVPRMRAMVASGEVTSLVASAVFDSEETVEEPSTEMAPEVVLESVTSEVVEKDQVADEALADDNIEDQPDAQDAEEESPEQIEDGEADLRSQMSEMKDMLAQALAEIAAIKGLPAKDEKSDAPAEDDKSDDKSDDKPAEGDDGKPAEDAKPAEAVPAKERSADDILAALDAIVKGTPDMSKLLADLDAKVGQ